MGTYAADLQTLSVGLLLVRVVVGGFANLAIRRRPAVTAQA